PTPYRSEWAAQSHATTAAPPHPQPQKSPHTPTDEQPQHYARHRHRSSRESNPKPFSSPLLFLVHVAHFRGNQQLREESVSCHKRAQCPDCMGHKANRVHTGRKLLFHTC